MAPREIAAVITRLNVNDESCSNHFVQCGVIEGLAGDQSGPSSILSTLRERRDTAVELLNATPGIRCFRPDVTFYLYPNVTEAMKRMKTEDYGAFRKKVLMNTGVSFCTRAHFGRPLPGEKEYYIRVAYSGIGVPEIQEGLGKLKQYLESTVKERVRSQRRTLAVEAARLIQEETFHVSFRPEGEIWFFGDAALQDFSLRSK